MPKVVAVLQARTNSSRLPGKVLMDFGGAPLLLQIINQVRISPLISELIVATTENQTDDSIVDICQRNKVFVYRGSENDVLGRVTEAARSADAEIVIRLTADNPFVNADLIDQGVSHFLRGYPLFDYVSNADSPDFPLGLYVEIIKFDSLSLVNKLDVSFDGREHVTTAFRRHPNPFKVHTFGTSLYFSNKFLTVDTRQDYDRLLPLYQLLISKGQFFTLSDIARFT